MLKENTATQQWTEDDDELLKKTIFQVHNASPSDPPKDVNWQAVMPAMNGRTLVSCRRRWATIHAGLVSENKDGPRWRTEDDQALIQHIINSGANDASEIKYHEIPSRYVTSIVTSRVNTLLRRASHTYKTDNFHTVLARACDMLGMPEPTRPPTLSTQVPQGLVGLVGSPSDGPNPPPPGAPLGSPNPPVSPNPPAVANITQSLNAANNIINNKSAVNGPKPTARKPPAGSQAGSGGPLVTPQIASTQHGPIVGLAPNGGIPGTPVTGHPPVGAVGGIKPNPLTPSTIPSVSNALAPSLPAGPPNGAAGGIPPGPGGVPGGGLPGGGLQVGRRPVYPDPSGVNVNISNVNVNVNPPVPNNQQNPNLPPVPGALQQQQQQLGLPQSVQGGNAGMMPGGLHHPPHTLLPPMHGLNHPHMPHLQQQQQPPQPQQQQQQHHMAHHMMSITSPNMASITMGGLPPQHQIMHLGHHPHALMPNPNLLASLPNGALPPNQFFDQ